MARVRVSTTVDEQLLASARQARPELADPALLDEALSALLARTPAVEVDAALKRDQSRQIGQSIVDGYTRVPQTEADVGWAGEATKQMIADEPW